MKKRYIKQQIAQIMEMRLVLVEDTDPYAKKLMDANTGQEYFVKSAMNQEEVQDFRRASALSFPEEFLSVIGVPKLVSEDRSLLPDEISDMADPIMIMEVAEGRDMQHAEYGLFGAEPVEIYESDWARFKQAIAYMNQQGVIHGDLGNVSNIFAQQDQHGFTKFNLIDWGGPAKGKPSSDLKDLLDVERRLKEKGRIIADPPDAIFNTQSRGKFTSTDRVKVIRNKDGKPVQLGSVHL